MSVELIIGLAIVLFLFSIVSVRLRRIRNALSMKDHKLDPGYIYFISYIGQIIPIVKIGYASDAPRRLNTHRTSAPLGVFVWCIVRVDDMNSAENGLHQLYHWMRLRKSREFFIILPPLFIDLILLRITHHIPEIEARQLEFTKRRRRA